MHLIHDISCFAVDLVGDEDPIMSMRYSDGVLSEIGSMEIDLNHPFVFFIQDNETGLILFMGRVMDPTR